MIFSEKIKLCSKLPEPSYHEFAQHHKMMHIRIIQSESNGNIQEGKKLDVLRSVGTPGLGYPLLLCLGKSLVVILDYVQTAGPLRSRALFTRQRSRTRPPAGEGLGAPRVPEEAGAQPGQPGAPDLPRSPGPPMGSRTPV